MEYIEFLKSRTKFINAKGFIVSDEDLNKNLFDFQSFCVKKAVEKGRFCLFEDCGLGKTLQQLSWAEIIMNKTNQSVLILSPLVVVDQTIQEGVKFGIEVRDFDSYNGCTAIYITNYEQLHNIDTSIFSGVVLDESSILKNFTGSIRNLIIDKFMHTPYKLACSATPSPNDPMELGNHAEFLGVMSRNEMLAMYFVHDGGNTSSWRLKGHATKLFWSWVSSWAIMITKPSDIGFDNDGYDLPDLNIIEINIDTEKKDNGMLFNNMSVNAMDFNAELRRTIKQRMELTADIVNRSTDSFIVWVKQNAESSLIKTLIPDSVEVNGSELPKIKKSKLLGFGKGEFRVLITKQKIAQYGLNYQNCHNQIYPSPDFSFEALYQSIRRSYRFGQKENVNIYIPITDTMGNVRQSINTKSRQFEQMKAGMVESMKSEFIKQNTITNSVEFKLPKFLAV